MTFRQLQERINKMNKNQLDAEIVIKASNKYFAITCLSLLFHLMLIEAEFIYEVYHD